MTDERDTSAGAKPSVKTLLLRWLLGALYTCARRRRAPSRVSVPIESAITAIN
jgi:hypothetical protein